MTVRPPTIFESFRSAQSPLDTLQHELLQEQATTLGRLGSRLESALAELEAAGEDRNVREALIAAAAEALWHFVVQREAIGLRNVEQALRHYRVPGAVRARMGVVLPGTSRTD